MDLTRAALAGIVLLVAAACTPQPDGPRDVVAAYFASLGRDPIRSLPLTTEAFHRSHGLSLVTTPEARAWRGGAQLRPPTAPEPVDRAQVAWLAIQNRADFEHIAGRLETRVEDVQEAGDVATVTVTVATKHVAPFLATFHLVRDGPGTAWRIDAVEESGVTPDNELAAFVAHPTEAARRSLAARARR